MKRCALLNCEVDDDVAKTLGELLKDNDEDVRNQVKLLIEKFGFKEDDIFCPNCFWK